MELMGRCTEQTKNKPKEVMLKAEKYLSPIGHLPVQQPISHTQCYNVTAANNASQWFIMGRSKARLTVEKFHNVDRKCLKLNVRNYCENLI